MSSGVPKKRLGKFGPMIPALGFGTMGLSSHYGEVPDDETRLKTLDRAYELGNRFWDTADMYGDSEDLIGKWFARTGKRSEIFLSSKFGIQWSRETGLKTQSDPEYMRTAIDKSLKRLGVDFIDLYYMHDTDGVTPIEDTVKAMAELQKTGKIKYIGLCGINKIGLRRAEAVHHIDSVQMEYSLFALDIEGPEGCLDTCRELGIAVVCLSPLGRGFLTGRYKTSEDFDADDVRRLFPRYSAENFAKNLRLVDYLQSKAERKGCTTAQLCLAFIMAQGDDIIPIPGTKSVQRLQENAGSFGVTLTAADLKEIRTELENFPVFGAHRPGGHEKNSILGQETPE